MVVSRELGVAVEPLDARSETTAHQYVTDPGLLDRAASVQFGGSLAS